MAKDSTAYSRPLLNEWNEKNHAYLAKLDKKVNALKDARLDDVNDVCTDIKTRIQELHDIRNEWARSPLTKAELLGLSKAEFREGRTKFVRDLLANHLGVCQKNRGLPLQPTTLRVFYFEPATCWKLFFAAFSEKDIEEAIKELPDIGVPLEEREAAIAAIDGEISRLSDLVDGLFTRREPLVSADDIRRSVPVPRTGG